jgi:hypothetical protein
MKRRSVFSLAALLAIAGCFRGGIEGDGVVKTESRAVTAFSSLEVTGACQIRWSRGQPALTVTTDQNLLPLVATGVAGEALQIAWKENLRPTRSITIEISSDSLADVQLDGAVSLTATNLSGRELKVESNGTSSIRLGGSVASLNAILSGAGTLDAKGLETQSASVSLDGAYQADVTVAEKLNASISGAGVLTYGGNPKTVETSVSGVGSIQPRS